MGFHSQTKSAAVVRAVLLTLTALVFLALTWMFAVPPAREIWYAYESRTWPSAQGLIGPAQVVRGSRGGSIPKVTYAYVVDNHGYVGNRLQFGYVNGSAEWAESVVSSFPVGPVKVYYSPSAPHESVLFVDALRLETYVFALALLATLGGPALWCLFQARKQFRARR